jgi:hypothetical protein
MTTGIDARISEDLLTKYGRAIVHMKQEINNKRFGMIFGAGASKNLGFPSWRDLIHRIADHPEVNSRELIKEFGSQTNKSQLLFQKFRLDQKNKQCEGINLYNQFESLVRARWHKIVHDCLYQDFPRNIKDYTKTLKDNDKYLKYFIELMRKSGIVVNYNFDDSLERLLAESKADELIKGYKTIWINNMPLMQESTVIYHPNGFLPYTLNENPSPQLVFLEDSFADQLIDSMSGHYASLSNYLAQTTCILIGLSLEDPTLRHLLRQNSIRYPGHIHYYIAHRDKQNNVINEKLKDSIADSNFEVYNLITLFLTTEEIATLGELLTLDDQSFKSKIEELGLRNIFRFYLTGPVGVGKTTIISQFQNLDIHEEWLEPLPEGMEKDPDLSKGNVSAIDLWIANQVGQKNLKQKYIEDGSAPGIHIIDRSPLDAFAFTPGDEWVDKAKLLKTNISPGQSGRQLCPGHIIFMQGDPKIMAIRAITCHKETNESYLNGQQEMLKKVYRENSEGITAINVAEKSVQQVTKEIARIIYQKEYHTAPMQEWLEQIESGEFHA